MNPPAGTTPTELPSIGACRHLTRAEPQHHEQRSGRQSKPPPFPHRRRHNLCTPQDKWSLKGNPSAESSSGFLPNCAALNLPPCQRPRLLPPSVLLSLAGNPIFPGSSLPVLKAGKKVGGKGEATPHKTDASTGRGTRSRRALGTQAKSF